MKPIYYAPELEVITKLYPVIIVIEIVCCTYCIVIIGWTLRITSIHIDSTKTTRVGSLSFHTDTHKHISSNLHKLLCKTIILPVYNNRLQGNYYRLGGAVRRHLMLTLHVLTLILDLMLTQTLSLTLLLTVIHKNLLIK